MRPPCRAILIVTVAAVAIWAWARWTPNTPAAGLSNLRGVRELDAVRRRWIDYSRATQHSNPRAKLRAVSRNIRGAERCPCCEPGAVAVLNAAGSNRQSNPFRHIAMVHGSTLTPLSPKMYLSRNRSAVSKARCWFSVFENPWPSPSMTRYSTGTPRLRTASTKRSD
jgi:hypothetical protein